MTFEEELAALLNKHSKENLSGTPDFILAVYISGCLHTYNETVTRREKWYGRPTNTISGSGTTNID